MVWDYQFGSYHLFSWGLPNPAAYLFLPAFGILVYFENTIGPACDLDDVGLLIIYK